MRVKHNKKNSKNKNIENNINTQYEEKYNDVILNDLVPEERKAEGLQLKQSITFNTSIPALEKYSNKYRKISIKKEI